MATTPEIQSLASGVGGSYRVTGVSNVARGYRVQSTSGGVVTVATPSAGESIDGVTWRADDVSSTPMLGAAATPGMPVQVQAENGGSFNDGDLLEVDADGRFRTVTTGTPVARALEDGGFNSISWAVFT